MEDRANQWHCMEDRGKKVCLHLLLLYDAAALSPLLRYASWRAAFLVLSRIVQL
jgi:hypothetical protein